jgi:uncharacterized membrane protein
MKEIKDQLLETLLHFLSQLPPEFIVMIISSFPILELRAALPIALGVYDMSFWPAYALSVLGNMLPVIPLLLLFQPLSQFMMRYKWYVKAYDWLYHRTMRNSKNVEKYGAIGLILFTAVPLPTTGAWTACVAASLFNIRFQYAFIAIFIGVLIAGLIMGGFSYSLFGTMSG